MFLFFNVRLFKEEIPAPKFTTSHLVVIYSFISLFITKRGKLGSQALEFVEDKSYLSGAQTRAKQAWFFYYMFTCLYWLDEFDYTILITYIQLFLLFLRAQSVLLFSFKFFLLAQMWPRSLSTSNTCHRKLISFESARVKLCFKKFGTADMLT